MAMRETRVLRCHHPESERMEPCMRVWPGEGLEICGSQVKMMWWLLSWGSEAEGQCEGDGKGEGK